jgi:hypothetical protein
MKTTTHKQRKTGMWSLPNVTGLGGAVAGGLAGVVTVVLSPVLAALTGVDMWDPLKVIAATVMGAGALAQSGFDLVPVLVGTLLYLAGAVLLGAIFGTLYRRVLGLTTEFGLPVYVGLVYGIMTYLIASAILLPATTLPFAAATASVTPLLAQQLVFAMCLGMFYTVIRPSPYQDTFEIAF